MELNNIALKEAIEYWSGQHEVYKRKFEKGLGLFMVIDEICKIKKIDVEVIENCVKGFALLAITKKDKPNYHSQLVEVNDLMLPMFDILKPYFKQVFVPHKIKSVIPGDVVHNIDGTIVPESYEAVLRFVELTSNYEDIIRNDIAALKRKFKEYNIDSYSSIVNESVKLSNDSKYSVREWSVVYYYAIAAGYYDNIEHKVNRREAFMNENKLSFSKENFRKQVIDSEKRINSSDPKCIKDIQRILPALKRYKKAKECAVNDIDMIRSESEQSEKY